MVKNEVESELAMLKTNTNFNIVRRAKQQGVVLFIAMIALVVMSLAAVALIRSVDTNSLITGNLSFKQTSITSASYAIEGFTQFLATKSFDNEDDAAYSAVDDRTNGYYASCNNNVTQSAPANICDGARLTNAATWKAGVTSKLPELASLSSPGKDAYGNTIEYIVERMCTTAGMSVKKIDQDMDPTTACLKVIREPEGFSLNVKTMPLAGGIKPYANIPIYRITVKVTGPKNTTSFVQAFIS